MKTIKAKILFAILAIFGGSLLTAGVASATCSSGFVNVTAVYEYSINGTPYGYIYGVSEHTILPSFVYYYYTTNITALNQAKMALQNHESLYFYGDAATCPTSGSYRYGGVLQGLYDY